MAVVQQVDADFFGDILPAEALSFLRKLARSPVREAGLD
jgi:hypothetical protein